MFLETFYLCFKKKLTHSLLIIESINGVQPNIMRSSAARTNANQIMSNGLVQGSQKQPGS